MRNNTRRAAETAIALRTRMPDAEIILWSRLRNRKLDGIRFRRQHPLGPYIADFACIAAKLIIEIDGASHWTETGLEHDRRRTSYLEAMGWRVIRISNAAIYRNLDNVLEHLASCARSPSVCGSAIALRSHLPR